MALSTTTMLIQVIIGLICLFSLIEANTNMTKLDETGIQKHLSQAATGLVALANQTNSTTPLANINNKLATASAKQVSETKATNKSHLSSLVVSPKMKKKSSESLTEAASEMMGDLSPAADHKKKKYILVKKKPKKKKPKKIKIKSYVKKYKTKYKKVKGKFDVTFHTTISQ